MGELLEAGEAGADAPGPAGAAALAGELLEAGPAGAAEPGPAGPAGAADGLPETVTVE